MSRIGSLSSMEKSDWLKSGEDKNDQAKNIFTSKYGSIEDGFAVFCGVKLSRSAAIARKTIETSKGFYIVSKSGDEFNTFNLCHVDDGYAAYKGGNLLVCIATFIKGKVNNPMVTGKELFEGAFGIPGFLAGKTKVQNTEEHIERLFGSFRRAGEIITGMTFPDNFKKNPESELDRLRYWKKDDMFQLMHKQHGPIATPTDFMANVGLVVSGSTSNLHAAGWNAVFDYFIGNEISFTVDPKVEADRIQRKKEQARKLEAKNKHSKEKAMEIVSRAVHHEEAALIYQEYIQQGRKQQHFEAFNLSKHIMVVHDVEYNNQEDIKNDKRKFTAVILPLTKQDENGNWKVCGLHAVYLEKVNGIWDKANIDLPKKDLSTWSTDTGMMSNMFTSKDSDILYIGEGNETMASFFGALLEPIKEEAEEVIQSSDWFKQKLSSVSNELASSFDYIFKTISEYKDKEGCRPEWAEDKLSKFFARLSPSLKEEYKKGVRDEMLESVDFDVKFTNTATRLQTAEINNYKQVIIVGDRDRSGTGYTASLKLREILTEMDVEAEIIFPPSRKVPLYIYLNESSIPTSLERCIEECNYWRGVDSLLKAEFISEGKAYNSRYESFIVIPDNYKGDVDNIDYPHLIKQCDIDKNVVPKGVDWDDALRVDPQLAFELEDLFYRLEDKQLANQQVA